MILFPYGFPNQSSPGEAQVTTELRAKRTNKIFFMEKE